MLVRMSAESESVSRGFHAYILGIDLGTTSVKVSLLDAKDGSEVGTFSIETEAGIQSPGAGSEQDVAQILAAVELCVQSFQKEHLANVVHIGICGQMHGVCLWSPYRDDLQRRVLNNWNVSNLYTWMDGRCDEDFLRSLPEPKTHLKLSSGHGCATLFWLARNQPESIREFQCSGTIMDLLVAYLCNLSKPVISVQNAASWGYCDTESESWNTDILNAAAFPVHLLPEILSSNVDVAGQLFTPWLGIQAGTSVGPGFGDLQCSIYSTLLDERNIFINFSTSAQIGYLTDTKEMLQNESQKIQYFPYFERQYFAVGASLNGGNVLASFVDLIVDWTKELDLNVTKDKIWTTILAAGCKVKETDLLVTATPFGERHAPAATASVSHISPKHVGLGHVMRGLCRGLVTNLVEFMAPGTLKRRGLERMVACGSAITRNPILQEELQATYGVEIGFRDASAARGVAMYYFNKSAGEACVCA